MLLVMGYAVLLSFLGLLKCHILTYTISKRILCICLQICWQLPLQHLAWDWHTPSSLIFFTHRLHTFTPLPRFNSQRGISSPPPSEISAYTEMLLLRLAQ